MRSRKREEGTKQQSGRKNSQDGAGVTGPELPVQVTWEKTGAAGDNSGGQGTESKYAVLDHLQK